MHNQPSSSRNIVLQPLPKAIGINPAYCINAQKTLLMKEKIFSVGQDAFLVHDENDQEVLRVKAKVFSMHHQKEVSDASGNPLFLLKQKVFAIPRQWYGESLDGGNQLFHVQGKWHLGGARESVTFSNLADGTGEPIELAVAGQWTDRHATIKWGEQLVAEITRDFFNLRNFLGSADTYYVTIAPGMDISLIAAIAVALDEREQEDKNKNN